MQGELLEAQRSLSGLRKDVNEADRNLQSQLGKLSELQSNAETAALSADADAVKPSVRSGRRGSRRHGRRRRR